MLITIAGQKPAIFQFMKTIRSKDNLIYKSAVKLQKKKFRDETGLYLIEGVKPLKDAFSMGINIENVFIRDDVILPETIPEDLCIIIGKDMFSKLSDTGTSQGIIAVAEKQKYDRNGFIDEVCNQQKRGKSSNIVILDRLQDPGNIGTIIRTAEAAGYKGIVLISGSGDVYSQKVVRAAAGSLFRMPVIYVDNHESAISLVKEMGKMLTVTCLEDAENCFDVDLNENIALVIGNEGRGVSEELIASSDIRVKIPMEGSIESLNAAVAAGILMYQSRKIK